LKHELPDQGVCTPLVEVTLPVVVARIVDRNDQQTSQQDSQSVGVRRTR
jgi:hypothetical protein